MQAAMTSDKRALPKRFYKTVSISEDNRVLLDAKPIKTPMKATLVLPNRALAESIAAEWNAQATVIDPSRMTITRLANTALDRVPTERSKMLAEIVEYAGSDLVCYRATSPERLVTLQREGWDSIIAWVNTQLQANFIATEGVMHRRQDDASLQAVARHVDKLDAFELVALHTVMTQTGSTLLSLQLLTRAVDAETAWKAAHIDEDFQSEMWGRDELAEQRRQQRKLEFDAAIQFLECLKAS